jgi:hypothetical protein
MGIPTKTTVTSISTSTLTQHALLVLWGQFAQYLALPQAFAHLPLHQKTYTHSPQTKLLEFLVATLAGLPHLVDISHAAHPLDQDSALAAAWGQPAWADASGVCRSLQALTGTEAEQVSGLLSAISRPFIDQEVLLALRSHGRLVYDGDLTGRPVSNTSTTYPGAAYGHMSDSVQLGYQAAMLSMHSPTYGRLWLGVTPHPGNTLSFGQAEALVRAAEAQTGVRPMRRVELLSARVAEIGQQHELRASQLDRAQQVFSDVERERGRTQRELWYWQGQAAELRAEYGPGGRGRAERPYSKLNRALARAAAQEKRLPKLDKRLVQVKQWVTEAEQRLERVSSEQGRLEARLEEFEGDNATNRSPIEAELRLDGGFGTGENLALLIELGYEIYTKPYSAQVTERLRERVKEQTEWTKVGGNAEAVGIASLTVHGCPYPLDGALERFYTGESMRYGTLVHYGRDRVVDELASWFSEYNGRQTIEAGIKEGKGVFQMHHLKVRSLPALYLQEQFAVFAANFVRWAGHWLVTNCQQVGPVGAEVGAEGVLLGGNGNGYGVKVKRQVQVGAHTSAWVSQQEGGWVLEFTDQSVYAGSTIRTREWVFQLPLPLFRNYDFVPI